jgi:hypothetical protein
MRDDHRGHPLKRELLDHFRHFMHAAAFA